MKVQVLGCSHHRAPIALRERLAFSPEQVRITLESLRRQYPAMETVLLSTCNRMEVYLASENGGAPPHQEVAEFLVRSRGLEPADLLDVLYVQEGREAVRHLFLVASSLDSMVIGEPQILSQVKQAYRIATEQQAAGPLTHAAFQAALKTARRVAGETSIHQRRVSIPSVAVSDFAQQIFERFDDKQVLVLGAGEMAEETLKYLRDEGVRRVTVVNRSLAKAQALAQKWKGRWMPWQQRLEALAATDLVVSTTGAEQAIVTMADFLLAEASRGGRPLFILDLAVPRDFEPAIGDRPGVYLYSIDDLQQVCQINRRQRDQELPAALKIVEEETDRFLGELHRRAVGPVIRRLRSGWEEPKEKELDRLFHKLPHLDDHARDEIRQSFERLVNKLLHPPMESLRHAARQGIPEVLLGALTRLFQLKD
jgi:glutamyl-tRNA reductase